jgi:hypothetical protein
MVIGFQGGGVLLAYADRLRWGDTHITGTTGASTAIAAGTGIEIELGIEIADGTMTGITSAGSSH